MGRPPEPRRARPGMSLGGPPPMDAARHDFRLSIRSAPEHNFAENRRPTASNTATRTEEES